MEEQVKYRASRATRKKKMKPSDINSSDLISKLPDPLLHHILSFLDMKHAIKTCILSRRWRYVWISLPILNFDERVFNPCLDSDVEFCLESYDEQETLQKPSHGSFLAFVIRALHCRGTTKIDEFHLDYKEYCEVSLLDLEDFMPMLTRRKVQVFDLKAKFGGSMPMFELPESLFRCASLTTLNLDMGSKRRPFFKIPDSVDDLRSPLRNLKSLHLRSIWLIGGVYRFIRTCPSLETLVIANCTLEDGELEIVHLQLKNLVIETMSAHEYSLDYCKIRVNAPSLTSFICRDYPINAYTFQRFSMFMPDPDFKRIPSLENADIDTDFMADYYLRPSQPAVKHTYSENVKTCLRGLQLVKSLTVSAWLLQIANEASANDWQRFHGVKVAAFCNLRILTLKTSLSVRQIQAITDLLKKCPVLENLVLRMTKEPELPSHESVGEVKSSSRKDDGHWDAELAPRCEICHLKSIEIRDVLTSPNELDFLKFLIRNATILKKIIVYGSKTQFPNERERKTFGEKLMKFQGATPRIGILFL